MKKMILKTIMILTVVNLVSLYAFAQPEIKLKKLPRGITEAKLKTHVIAPENTQNVEMEELSRAAETQIPPQAVRLAIGGKGDIYAVYALGDVYGTFNYNEEDLMTFHFIS